MQLATDEVGTRSTGFDPDGAIALRARTDPDAFADLYNRYAKQVISYFLVRTKSREDAEDLASQVFVRAFEALPRFRSGEGTVRSWLFAIAHNLAISHFRSTRQTRSIDDIDVLDRAPSPEDHAAFMDDVSRLKQALALLTDEQRAVVELRLAGLSGIEISRALGKSHAAIKMLQHRAIEHLRDVLQPPSLVREAER